MKEWPNLLLLGILGIIGFQFIKKFISSPKTSGTPCKTCYDKALKNLRFVTTFHNVEDVLDNLKRDLLE